MPPSEQLIAEIRQEFPALRIVDKTESRISRWIDWGLRVVTLGRQRRYLTHYHTVIGQTLYLPASWHTTSEAGRVIVLRHERVHLRQRQRLGFSWMAFLYLVPFFPVGLAYGRARLEWEAYQETLRATAELAGLSAIREPGLRAEIVRRFTGPDYLFMWPFRAAVERWYDAEVAALEARAASAGGRA